MEADNEEDSDEDDRDNNDNNENGLTDHEREGRLIQCLRSKYVDTSVTFDSQCIVELITVIQTSKLNVKFDIRLYQSCRKYLTTECTGIDQEDCLKLLYQKGQLVNDDCKEQVKRIIKEGKLYLNAVHALFFTCQVDILKICNNIPIGSVKQSQCLLNMRNLVSDQCKKMLLKREELWNNVSNEWNIMNAIDNTLREHTSCSTRFPYVTYSVIFIISVVMLIIGYIYRAHYEYNRTIEYKC